MVLRLSQIGILCFVIAVQPVVGCQRNADGSAVTPPPQPSRAAEPQVDKQPGAANVDPRKLLSEAEAEAIFRQKVRFTEPEQLGQFASTRVENEHGNILAMLQISTIDYDKAKFDSDVAESAKLLDTQFDAVAGFGDGAYRMDEMLMVLEKGKWVQVAVPKRPGVDQVACGNQVMEKALSRVP